MNRPDRSTAIRSKILLLAISGPGLALLLAFLATMKLFSGDRVAELFDSSRQVSAALSGELRSELLAWREQMRLVAGDVDPARGNPGEFARQLVKRSEKLQAVWVVTEGTAGHASQWLELRKDAWQGFNAEPLQERFPELIHRAISDGFAFRVLDLGSDDRFACHALALCKPIGLAATAAGDTRSPERKFVIAAVDAAGLLATFGEATELQAYLVNAQGMSLLSSDPVADGAATDFSGWPFFRKLKERGPREGAEENPGSDGAPVLVSYAPVGLAGLSVVSVTAKSAALRATRVPLWRAAFFSLALLALAVFGALAASRRLARPAP